VGWKKEHYFKYHQGHNCGICSAIYPYGINALNKEPLTFNKETPHDPYE
jgi:hypothetical protein